MGSLWSGYRASQAGRVAGDAAVMAVMTDGISGIDVREARPPRGSAFVDALLARYLRLVLPVIRWLDRRRGLG